MNLSEGTYIQVALISLHSQLGFPWVGLVKEKLLADEGLLNLFLRVNIIFGLKSWDMDAATTGTR